ncbi:MAG: hypothetical protein IPL89_01300 [Acidobacteria bacterium]|nr:hypothetical protein [Acidobacteriota bacterium]
MNARALPCLFLLALPLAPAPAAAQEPPDALVPEYELTVADGARLRSLFKDNAWMKEFAASNLARGTMVRLGPVLYAVGRDGKDGWTGRLIDFVADRFLEKRPVKLSYFHTSGLVSPIGITFPDLTAREQASVHLVLQGLRSGPDLAREVADDEGGAVSVSVTPLALRLQKFAAVETKGCLALSRDPRVAATLSRNCALDPRLAAATLDLRTDEFFSAWSAVLEKLFGVGPRLRVTFDWDKKAARFTPSGAALQLAQHHALGTASLDPALLAAIPADAPFLATAVLPDPGHLDASSAEEYFRTAPGKRGGGAYVPVTLVSLGMRAGTGDREGRAEAMSVLLIPRSGAGEKTVADLDALFNRHRTFEVHASRACPGVVALSPSKAALARVADACSGRKPSFRQAPPKIVGALSGGPISTAAFLNVGGFLRSALLWGWQREAPSPPKGGDDKGPPPPPKELVDAMQLLDRLPMYAFSGRAVGDAVVMTGVEP